MAHKFVVEAGEQTQLCSDGVGVGSAGGLGCWQAIGGNKANGKIPKITNIKKKKKNLKKHWSQVVL